MKAIGYIRVSTEGQAKEGVSLESQRAKVESWAKHNDYQLVRIYTDAGISGCKVNNRPGLQKAIEAACKQKAAMVVYSLSRMVRSTKDALTISDQLDRAGADLVSLTEKIDTTSAAGKMVFRMLAVLAEFERDLVSERTTATLSHLRQQGRRISGKIPFGYNLAPDGKTLTKNPVEQRGVQLICELREGGNSLRKIAEELETHGIQTKHGKPWSAKVIRDILKRTA